MSAARQPAEERVDGVLVVGGGYAGLHAARAVKRAGRTVTIVDRSGSHDLITRLAGVAGGAAPSVDAGIELARLADDVRIGIVASVDDGSVLLADGRRLVADAVVVTAGAVPTRPPIDGIEHAATLRSAADARRLRSVLGTTREVVIVGGGATGVQLAGAVAHARPEVEVHLVDAAPSLLASLRPELGAGAERILRQRGVRVHLGRSVRCIAEDGVWLESVEAQVPGDGSEGLLRGAVVWAGGFEADTAELGVPVSADGRIAVGGDLRIIGLERTFAAGDVAAHTDSAGHPLAMSAQIAVQAGTMAGDNAVRVLRGQPTRTADLRQRGWVLDLSGRRGVAEVGPLPLAGPILDLLPPLLHDAVDLKNLLEIGGVAALRFAPDSVRSLVCGLPALPGWPLAVRNPLAQAAR